MENTGIKNYSNEYFDMTFKELLAQTPITQSLTSWLVQSGTITSRKINKILMVNKQEALSILSDNKKYDIGKIKREKEMIELERSKKKLEKEKIELDILKKKILHKSDVKDFILSLSEQTKMFWQSNAIKLSNQIASKLKLNNEHLVELNIIVDGIIEQYLIEYAEHIKKNMV